MILKLFLIILNLRIIINVRSMQLLINNILRPYRSTYTINDLGKRRTDSYVRSDGSIYNDRDLLIQYSYYEHVKKTDICVVYCHCNSGSRIQGFQYTGQLIQKGWNVCLFDFSGSGQSQGEYISLGHYESRDLDIVLKKMRLLGNRKFLLWGRSMGAATIIFYLNQSKFRDDIMACVLDSPYASLWSLIKQVGQSRSMLPGFIIERVLDFMRDKIKEQHLFDIKQLQPLRYVANIDQPLFLITSLMDECVKSEDVIDLYKQAGSKIKQLQYIDKPHNSPRDKETIDSAIHFFAKSINQKMKRKKQLKVFVKNNKDLTGANMADLIVRAEREKDIYRRMKSQVNIDRSAKENRNSSNQQYMKTDFTANPSANLSECRTKYSPRRDKKIKAIKFSLAHIEYRKKSATSKMQIRYGHNQTFDS